MRQIVKEIVKNLWNGKANIIQFNRSMDIDDFLLHDIKNAIQEADKNCFFFQASPENTKAIDLLDNIKRTRDLLKDNKMVFIINDLFYFDAPLAIINSFYGKNNITAIITTDIDIVYALKNKDTQIRGRYNKYFLAPELYGEKADTKDYHLTPLLNFVSKNEAAEIYKYIVRHSGEVLSFRQIFESVKVNKSLPFYIDAINYMNKTGMIYMLNRYEIKKGKKLSSGVVFYPTYISDIDLLDLPYEKRFKLKNEAYLVAKMISDNYVVYKAISYYSDIVDGKYKSRVEFNRGFLIEYYDRRCVIRIDFDDDDETINRFKKAKNNIPHLIAVLGEMALIIDKDGTAYCGLQTLLEKGLDGYGGFSKD